ncbi:DUF7317 family protein [Haloarcula argentinensis]|uniref:UPF0175 family protein n=1 Tax=Haloarcula argentinensis TaxID=43776 RepID=A0A830FPW5_HALAR|nr:UPF0175 family protein [Haloarcula argentinensis]EMA24672.1 hypothetical protein C443_05919 [Haloarcula argentinensis DSM 12282]MDS0253210.1 UPF0175 family protein [Haloarcula argentinensis]GGM26031.1 hypothetical protein GCM10009006_04290 [Haloarcula argentinensis]
MSHRTLTTALTLYRGETLTLKEAATYGGVSPAKFATALRSRGIQVRDEDGAPVDQTPN